MKQIKLFVLLHVLAMPLWADAVKTEVVDGQLLRDGKPYVVKGAGISDGPVDLFVQCGGNSLRTWGIKKDTGEFLDEAHKRGLTVTVGIWLMQRKQGFDYNNTAAVEKQAAHVREAIEKFKDHPAVLAWGIGNEVEMRAKDTGADEDVAMWKAINDLAAMAHQLDPNHPTVVVIAEMGPNGDKVKHLHKHCPAIDIVGINSYGGAASIPERYRKAGGTKPYIVTEFGPRGMWESKKTEWGAEIEPTSNEKAEHYRRAYEGFTADKELCLGSYAFLWGQKKEGTCTWFGMFLPDGKTRTPAVDAMMELWSGKPPANRCPVIKSLTVDKGRARLEASDPDGDRLQVEWLLMEDVETASPIPGAIVRSDAKGAEVEMPAGKHRLFALVRDGKGGGSAANVPVSK